MDFDFEKPLQPLRDKIVERTDLKAFIVKMLRYSGFGK